MRYTRFVQDVGAQHRIAPTTVPHLKGKRYNSRMFSLIPKCLKIWQRRSRRGKIHLIVLLDFILISKTAA